ncbi:MAG: hypothetical protein Q4G43_16775, partial [Mobilicoccus sp.]|nr:hypothetical protein [Mobilicoccus sp.]
MGTEQRRSTVATMWGIHNDALGSELVEQGFISVGWDAMPDLRTIGDDMTRMKECVHDRHPSGKPGAIPIWAGVLRRFAFEIQIGDVIIAPYRPDSTLNFGVVAGGYEYHPEVPTHRHRRRVSWRKTGVARSTFPQEALYEIGSAVTLFQIKRHEAVFRAYLDADDDSTFDSQTTDGEDTAG